MFDSGCGNDLVSIESVAALREYLRQLQERVTGWVEEGRADEGRGGLVCCHRQMRAAALQCVVTGE